jgi:hypothetical protein
MPWNLCGVHTCACVFCITCMSCVYIEGHVHACVPVRVCVQVCVCVCVCVLQFSGRGSLGLTGPLPREPALQTHCLMVSELCLAIPQGKIASGCFSCVHGVRHLCLHLNGGGSGRKLPLPLFLWCRLFIAGVKESKLTLVALPGHLAPWPAPLKTPT